MESDPIVPPGALNENQQRHLRVSCQYVDKLLSDASVILDASASGSPFSRYVDDLTPVQKRVFRDYTRRIRSLMLRILEAQGLEPAPARVSALYALRTTLSFVEIAAEELKPRYMRGYGAVPEAAEPWLNGLVVELQGVIRQLDAYLARGAAGDLPARIARLSGGGDEIAALAALDRIIGTHGLVEFRPALGIILDRLEDRRFEVAVFGRVSTGKSSLLNHVLGTGRLPIGVTPITAVPTRIQFGPVERLSVWFAERAMEQAEPARIGEFITETANPGNAKHVTRIVLELPSPRLQDGVVLVDTPGLGSLATDGAAETLAYLPRCDHGVVLFDAASAMTPEDLGTVRRLLEAGIPVSVLLSKADLLTPDDLDRMTRYVDERLRAEFGSAPPVRPISVAADRAALLDGWLREDLLPLFERHRDLAQQSLSRKIGVLRENVAATLQAMLDRAGRTPSPARRSTTTPDGPLRATAGEFERVRSECEIECESLRHLGQPAFALAARIAVEGRAATIADSLRSALETVSGERAARIQQALSALTERAAATLADAARVLDLPVPEVDEDVITSLRERPRFAPPTLPTEPRLTGLRIAGDGVARWRVTRWLRGHAADDVQARLEAHAAVLRDWSLHALGRIRGWYSAHAEGFRAQLEPAEQAGAPETRAALRRDLDELQQHAPA